MRIIRFYIIEVQRGYSSKLDNKGYNTLYHHIGELERIEMVGISM